MGHVQRRGPKRWKARYSGPDGRERSRTFVRKVDAERFLANVATDQLRGQWVDPRLSRKTFAEWTEEYQRSRVDLQPSTMAQQTSFLRKHILPRFGDRPLDSISEMHVRMFVSDLLACDLAPSSVTKVLGTMSQILRAAVRNQLLVRNPCEGVPGPGDAPREETIYLTPDEVGDLTSAMPERFRAMVLLAAYRGLRFGEAAGLRPARLNLLLGRLDVAEALKEVDGHLFFGPPKHGRPRTLRLPPFLVDALREHVVHHPPVNNVVFTNADGSLLRRSNFERRVWAPAVAAAQLPDGLTFHGLRHTAVSIMIAEGASIVELASVMGWARSTAVAMAVRYGHLFATREDQLNDALERVFRNAGRPVDGLGGEPFSEAEEKSAL